MKLPEIHLFASEKGGLAQISFTQTACVPQRASTFMNNKNSKY
jgi:hypothetical protein